MKPPRPESKSVVLSRSALSGVSGGTTTITGIKTKRDLEQYFRDNGILQSARALSMSTLIPEWDSMTDADIKGRTILIGTNGADTITGTSGNDLIIGLGGDDTINAGEGNDIIIGGRGDDIIDAGGGNDTVFGNDHASNAERVVREQSNEPVIRPTLWPNNRD